MASSACAPSANEPDAATDAGDAGSTCLLCPSDADVDASLGLRAYRRLGLCGGIEGCHQSNAGDLSFPAGDEARFLVNVPSSEEMGVLRVVPGDPRASYLYRKVSGDPSIDGGQMPLGGPYDPAVSALFFAWIEAGAPKP